VEWAVEVQTERRTGREGKTRTEGALLTATRNLLHSLIHLEDCPFGRNPRVFGVGLFGLGLTYQN